MDDRIGAGGAAAAAAGDPEVLVHGLLVRGARGIRTAEGWEVASLRVGGLLAICAGPGAAAVADALVPGDEVVVVGRLTPRRGAQPDGDAVEVEVRVVLARTRPGVGDPVRPRIAP